MVFTVQTYTNAVGAENGAARWSLALVRKTPLQSAH